MQNLVLLQRCFFRGDPICQVTYVHATYLHGSERESISVFRQLGIPIICLEVYL